MTYNITSKAKFKYFYKPLLIGLFIDVLIVLIIGYFDEIDLILALKLFLAIFIGQLILYSVPLYILYNNYFRINKFTALSIDEKNNTFTLNNKTKTIILSKEDIIKVVLNLSISLYERRPTWLYWDELFYYNLITTKGNFYVSCLVINNLEDYVPKDKIERKKVYFPLMKKIKTKDNSSN